MERGVWAVHCNSVSLTFPHTLKSTPRMQRSHGGCRCYSSTQVCVHFIKIWIWLVKVNHSKNLIFPTLGTCSSTAAIVYYKLTMIPDNTDCSSPSFCKCAWSKYKPDHLLTIMVLVKLSMCTAGERAFSQSCTLVEISQSTFQSSRSMLYQERIRTGS